MGVLNVFGGVFCRQSDNACTGDTWRQCQVSDPSKNLRYLEKQQSFRPPLQISYFLQKCKKGETLQNGFTLDDNEVCEK